jgi:hypothetical protein
MIQASARFRAARGLERGPIDISSLYVPIKAIRLNCTGAIGMMSVLLTADSLTKFIFTAAQNAELSRRLCYQSREGFYRHHRVKRLHGKDSPISIADHGSKRVAGSSPAEPSQDREHRNPSQADTFGSKGCKPRCLVSGGTAVVRLFTFKDCFQRLGPVVNNEIGSRNHRQTVLVGDPGPCVRAGPYEPDAPQAEELLNRIFQQIAALAGGRVQ